MKTRDKKHLHAREKNLFLFFREITNTYIERNLFSFFRQTQTSCVRRRRRKQIEILFVPFPNTHSENSTEYKCVLFIYLFTSSCSNGRKETINTKKCSLGLRLQLQEELYGQEQKQANGYMETRRENWGAANMVYK
jgi:hypothetical protein